MTELGSRGCEEQQRDIQLDTSHRQHAPKSMQGQGHSTPSVMAWVMGRSASSAHSQTALRWREWLTHQIALLPCRGTLARGEIEVQRPHEVQKREMQSPTPWGGIIPSISMCCGTGRLCRRGPRGPAGHRVAHKPAVCPKKSNRILGCTRTSVAGRSMEVILHPCSALKRPQ